MTVNFSEFSWTREPEQWQLTDESLSVTTQPHTDLWQRTYYHFQNDNAPLFQMTTAEDYFSFTVKVDFQESHHRFDQAGIVLYLDSENWLKASLEYENEDFQHLGSVVTNQGYSDWATAEVAPDVKQIYYRLSRRQDDFKLDYSLDGQKLLVFNNFFPETVSLDLPVAYQAGQVLISNYDQTELGQTITLQPYQTLAILVG